MAEVESLDGEPRADGRGVQLREHRARARSTPISRRTRSTSVAARKSLGVAQKRIAERLRDLYVNGEGDSTLEVISRVEQPRRHHRPARRDRARLERGHADPPDGQAVPQGGRDPPRQLAGRARRPGADRRRAGRAEAGDRVAARGAERLLSSVKDEIAQMQAEEARRQAALAAQARARAQAAQLAAQQAAAQQTVRHGRSTLPEYDANVPAARYGPRSSRDRAAVPRRCRTSGAGRAPRPGSTARASWLRLRADRRLSPAPRRVAVRLRDPGLMRPAGARRPRLLQRSRPHRDLHRRRPVHPRAAHGRRREDLEPRTSPGTRRPSSALAGL